MVPCEVLKNLYEGPHTVHELPFEGRDGSHLSL